MNATGRRAQPSLFDVPDAAPLVPSLRLPPRPSSRRPARGGCRRRRPRLRRRSPPQRRARGVGGHGQDVGARRPLRQPAEGRRRPGQHPGDHVHAQGRRRDARAHPARAAPRRRTIRARSGALARPARSARRHRHQHDRRVLPVAAARVPARGRRRSRLRARRRNRGAAAHRHVARPDDADPGRPSRARIATSRWCWRSSASRARATAWPRCSIAGSSPGTRSTASSRAARAT